MNRANDWLTQGEWPQWRSRNGQTLQWQGGDELVSAEGGDRVPIVRGIPRFVEDGYALNFGAQWKRFPKTQLDSHTGLPLSRERVERTCGPELFGALSGKCVLEAGCGAGRFTEVLLGQGARVMSIDLSQAVEANAGNFPPDAKHRIAQASILELPFAPGQFDVVVCLGVIQHTPDPEATIERLYEQVKPGGWLVIDHYTHERRWGNTKPFFRAYMKRLKPEQLEPMVTSLVNRFLPWHRRFRHFYPAWFLLCRISPITTFYRTIPQLPEQLQREFALLDTHDSLTDWFKHIRTKEQIEETLAKLPSEAFAAWYAGNGVEARCRKPVTG